MTKRGRLGWRSRLAVALLGVMMLAMAVAALLVASASSIANAFVLPVLAALGLAGGLLPLLVLVLVIDVAPASPLPGTAFARSRSGLLLVTLFVLTAVGTAMLLLPVVHSIVLASRADATSLPFVLDLLAVTLPLVPLLLAVAAWSFLRPHWHWRRWPFAVIGPETLWLAGKSVPIASLRETRAVQLRGFSALIVRADTKRLASLTFSLAGPVQQLETEIAARIMQQTLTKPAIPGLTRDPASFASS